MLSCRFLKLLNQIREKKSQEPKGYTGEGQDTGDLGHSEDPLSGVPWQVILTPIIGHLAPLSITPMHPH